MGYRIMKGENHQVLTEAADASSADPTKTRFRQVFVSLLADAKGFPGGISALARVEGRNPVVLADQINPDNHSKSPPTMAAFLELLENGQCRRAIAGSVAPALFVSRKPRSAGPAFEPKESPSRIFKAPQRNADDEAIQRAKEKRTRKASKRIRQAAGATK